MVGKLTAPRICPQQTCAMNCFMSEFPEEAQYFIISILVEQVLLGIKTVMFSNFRKFFACLTWIFLTWIFKHLKHKCE